MPDFVPSTGAWVCRHCGFPAPGKQSGERHESECKSRPDLLDLPKLRRAMILLCDAIEEGDNEAVRQIRIQLTRLSV